MISYLNEYQSFIFVTRVTRLIHDAGKYLLISVYPLPTHPTHNFTHKNGRNLDTLSKKLHLNRPARCAGQSMWSQFLYCGSWYVGIFTLGWPLVFYLEGFINCSVCKMNPSSRMSFLIQFRDFFYISSSLNRCCPSVKLKASNYLNLWLPSTQTHICASYGVSIGSILDLLSYKCVEINTIM